MDETHPAIATFYTDLDIAIATTERMASMEAHVLRADQLRCVVNGLARARQIMERAVAEALHEGNH